MIAVGGAAGIASGIAGEVPTVGGTTAILLGGLGALWDGMDKLSECEWLCTHSLLPPWRAG